MTFKHLSPFFAALVLTACGGDATSPASTATDTAASAAAPAATVAQSSSAVAATPVVACDRACLPPARSPCLRRSTRIIAIRCSRRPR